MYLNRFLDKKTKTASVKQAAEEERWRIRYPHVKSTLTALCWSEGWIFVLGASLETSLLL